MSAQEDAKLPTKAEVEAARPVAAGDSNEPVKLSPFTVSTEKDSGYFSANTLAGSRMDTNLADLGSSISVVTRQQFEDTASTDINDIFRYEVNTEGSLTYTPGSLSMRGDGVLDVNAGGTRGNAVESLTNAGANRVRGLGAPSSAYNYYPSIDAVPFDTYNLQTLEISRGPNSMLFGLGSPAGIVNLSTAQAQLNKRSAQAQFRTDQYGSFRSSFNFNQGLIEDTLAIYGAAVYDDRQFDRKPSYDRTTRFYGAITYKPFSKTTLRFNAESYKNDNRRPNTLTPRDFVSQWNSAGRPYYDGTTHTIYSLNTGAALSMIVDNASSPYANALRAFIESRPGFDASKWNGNKTTYNGFSIFGIQNPPTNWVAGTPSPNILYVPGIGGIASQARSVMQIADGQLANWFQPTYTYRYLPGFGVPGNPAGNPALYPTTTAIYANSTWADYYTRPVMTSAGWSATGNGVIGGNAGYKYPGVTDSSIYDWRSVNINSMNFGTAENQTFNFELEQELPGDLFLSAGWMRQDYSQRTNYTVAQLNVATLWVDTNKYLPDGTPNPYFGLPYVDDQDPDSYTNDELDDHYRAMLAWTPDFTQKEGWIQWLGRHQILGLWSKDQYQTTTARQRLHYVAADAGTSTYRFLNNPNNNADGTPTGWAKNTAGSLRRHYYLGAPGDPYGVVSRSAGTWDPLTYSGKITAYDYDSSSFVPLGVTTQFIDTDAGTGRNQRLVDSVSWGITSHLWQDRLVTTFGWREDTYKARVTNNGLGAVTDANGNVVAPAITNAQKWVNGVFQRDLLFNRWGPYNELKGRTSTMGGVLRPFQGWGNIEARADHGSQAYQFIRGLGFSFNKSDNFNPPSTALGDFYGKPLPKPTGTGRDFGFQFSLMNDRLFGRVTWFKATNENENIAAPLVFGRLSSNVDQTLFRNWARTIALINMGKDPTADGFGTNLSTAEENAVQAAAATIWKLPYEYYGTLPYTLGATRNAEAKGIEAEINYNPTRNWTMKFTFGKQDTKYASVVKEFLPWEADRMAVWKAAKASTYLLPQYQGLATYTTTGGRAVDLSNFWSSYGYRAELFPEAATGFANPEAYYGGVVSPQLALDRDLQGQSVQGQRKYRWSFLTSYSFTEGMLRNFTIGGNQRWEDKAVIGYYGKASGVNTYNGQPVLDYSDVNRPIYDDANFYTDLSISYRRRIFHDKVGMKIQLNVNNVFEDGRLRPVGVNYDGSPYAYRIVDPRQYVLTTTFDF